jgi:hypothetical protein
MITFPKISDDLSRVSIPSCVQPKFDGECVVWNGNRLINRNGRERRLPLCDILPKNIKLSGELYWGDGKRNFYEALSPLKTDDPLLKFAIFALYEADLPFVEQLKVLKMLQTSDKVSVVEGMNAYSHLEVEHMCEMFYKEQGYEGAVIKPLMNKSPESWIKYKPDQTIDLVILGISKKHSAIAVGRLDGKVMGHCSLYGHKEVSDRIATHKIIGDTKEDYLIMPDVVIEVLHYGIIEGAGSLRSPRISRLREDLGVKDVG